MEILPLHNYMHTFPDPPPDAFEAVLLVYGPASEESAPSHKGDQCGTVFETAHLYYGQTAEGYRASARQAAEQVVSSIKTRRPGDEMHLLCYNVKYIAVDAYLREESETSGKVIVKFERVKE